MGGVRPRMDVSGGTTGAPPPAPAGEGRLPRRGGGGGVAARRGPTFVATSAPGEYPSRPPRGPGVRHVACRPTSLSPTAAGRSPRGATQGLLFSPPRRRRTSVAWRRRSRRLPLPSALVHWARVWGREAGGSRPATPLEAGRRGEGGRAKGRGADGKRGREGGRGEGRGTARGGEGSKKGRHGIWRRGKGRRRIRRGGGGERRGGPTERAETGPQERCGTGGWTTENPVSPPNRGSFPLRVLGPTRPTKPERVGNAGGGGGGRGWAGWRFATRDSRVWEGKGRRGRSTKIG